MAKPRIAVIDDWQNAAKSSTDWSPLEARAEIQFFSRHFGPQDEEEAVRLLAEFDIICILRERSRFPASLLARLPRLRMLALTGTRSPNVDIGYCSAHGIPCSKTVARAPSGAGEMTLALILAAARHIPAGDANIRAGRFQLGIPPGSTLRGRTLGIVGLGRLGRQVAGYGKALGMRVLAWSQNLTAEKAREGGAELVDKAKLFSESDVISVHLVLSDRTRHIVGAEEFALMKPGALFVNTSRGPLADEAALIESLNAGRIRAALDVYDREPLPADHPLLRAPGTVLSPHVGFTTEDSLREFYEQSIENILAFLDGNPIRVVNPELGGTPAPQFSKP